MKLVVVQKMKWQGNDVVPFDIITAHETEADFLIKAKLAKKHVCLDGIDQVTAVARTMTQMIILQRTYAQYMGYQNG